PATVITAQPALLLEQAIDRGPLADVAFAAQIECAPRRGHVLGHDLRWEFKTGQAVEGRPEYLVLLDCCEDRSLECFLIEWSFKQERTLHFEGVGFAHQRPHAPLLRRHSVFVYNVLLHTREAILLCAPS